MRSRARSILLLLLCAAPLLAAEKKPLTVDDMWAVQRVGTPAMSPDGKAVAYTVSVYDVEENRSNGDVWSSRWPAARRGA